MEQRENDILDSAVAAWRRSSRDESLSDTARTALFSEIRAADDVSGVTFVPSLTRVWRWAFLGSVPVVALAAVLITVGDRGNHVASPRLSASKVNGQLVFSLANGKTDHVIYRSTDPHSFNRATAVKMAKNQYAEDAAGGPTLVFIELTEFCPALSTQATRGDSMIRDLLLDPRQFPGRFNRNLSLGTISNRSRAFGPGVEQTSEEIG